MYVWRCCFRCTQQVTCCVEVYFCQFLSFIVILFKKNLQWLM